MLALKSTVRLRWMQLLKEKAMLLKNGTGIVGNNTKLVRAVEEAQVVALTVAVVLVTGETGTGKELLAQLIHKKSGRAGAFVPVNCAAIPPELAESEFFGHTKGSFTGAASHHRGVFEQAQGGTLFLDEIGDMPLALQPKLLRVLEGVAVRRVGAHAETPIDVRIIAATNRNPAELVQERRFRQDLLYRLNGIRLHLVPLRDRVEDIPLLIEHFLGEANQQFGKAIASVAPALLQRLTGYSWPGNIRELGNVIGRAVMFAKGSVLDVGDLPPEMRDESAPLQALPPGGVDLNAELAKYEWSLIDRALEQTKGNRAEAARLLGINRTTLVEKLRRREGADREADPSPADA